jgi:hypothetical protein
MKGKLLITIALSLVNLGLRSVAQSPSNIINPIIEYKNDRIEICYDIPNSSLNDSYYVRLEVTNAAGEQLAVSALEGDVGINVAGGKNKIIIWNPAADGIIIDEDIFIQLFADKFTTPTRSAKAGQMKDFNRAAIVMQSLAVPGLGLSRVTGKPHWIRGVAGYACIGGSVAFSLKSKETYRAYEGAESAGEAEDLFDQSLQQDQISEILAYSAIGIWVIDFIWTMVGTSGSTRSLQSGPMNNISVGTAYNHISGTPMLAIKYQF